MQTCAICYNHIKCDTDGFKTPCNHFMHNSCLTHWLLLKNTCPICRYNINGKRINNEDDIDIDIDIENETDSDEEYDIEVNLINEIYTSNYNKILESLRELLFSMTLNNEDIENFTYTKDWCYDNINDTYYLIS